MAQESFQKALRSLETGCDGWSLPRKWKRLEPDRVVYLLRVPTPERVLVIKQVPTVQTPALERPPRARIQRLKTRGVQMS